MSKFRPDRVGSVKLNFGLSNKSSSKLVILKKIKKYLKFLFDPFRPGKVQKPIFLTRNRPESNKPDCQPCMYVYIFLKQPGAKLCGLHTFLCGQACSVLKSPQKKLITTGYYSGMGIDCFGRVLESLRF